MSARLATDTFTIYLIVYPPSLGVLSSKKQVMPPNPTRISAVTCLHIARLLHASSSEIWKLRCYDVIALVNSRNYPLIPPQSLAMLVTTLESKCMTCGFNGTLTLLNLNGTSSHFKLRGCVSRIAYTPRKLPRVKPYGQPSIFHLLSVWFFPHLATSIPDS